MTTQNLLLILELIPVGSMFYCLPFVIYKLQTDDAKRDSRDLPFVKRQLLIRVVSSFGISAFLLISSPSAITFIMVSVLFIPVGAYCLGKYIMLKKLEKHVECQQGVAPDPPLGRSLEKTTADIKDSNQSVAFNEVWYLPHKRTWFDGNLIAYDDVGELTVTGTGAEFVGKTGRVEISSVHRVSYGKQGRDFINKWVKIEYQDKVAYFADGREQGWSGVHGGTRNMLSAVQHLVSEDQQSIYGEQGNASL